MPGKMNTKLKLLYLADILEKKTDDEHTMSATELCDALNECGVTSERKSIYKDVDVLRAFGYDVILSTDKKNSGYFMGSRKFELAELRLLSDAVQAAGFITPKKTEMLVKKIESFASENQAAVLHSQVYVDGQRKCCNEELYYTVSRLYDAVNSQKKVTFTYTRRKITGTFRTQKEEKTMTVSPYALIWSDDHYYLICNYDKYDNTMNLRIDRISGVVITDEPWRHFSEVTPYKEKFDAADYSVSHFNMFSGDPKPIELICSNLILEPMLDRFGEKVKIQKVDDEHFALKTYASVSDGLAQWVLQFGGNIRVTKPNDLAYLVKEKARAALANYEDNE